jgi:hypothetical protein
MRRTTVTDISANLDKPKFDCHARRHMSGAMFKTYDAMLAMAKAGKKHIEGQPWVFCGRVNPTLANHTNSSPDQLAEHIKWLVENKWLIFQRRVMWENNVLGQNEYIILTHGQYKANVGGCPPFKYAQDKNEEKGIKAGDKIAPKGKQPEPFAMQNHLRRLGKVASGLLRAEVTFTRKKLDE